MKEAVIVAYGRSAIGKAPKGTLKYSRPEDIAAQVVKGVMNKVPQLDPSDIDDFVLGCAFPEAEQGLNVARIIGMLSGLPQDVPGQTVNRFCASGLQSISTAANLIMAGQADVILAGGVEFMSTVPMGGNIPALNLNVVNSYPDLYVSMGITAENVAGKYSVTREMQDKFAAESHRRAAKAQKDGKFSEEIIPVTAVRPSVGENGNAVMEEFIFDTDEGIRLGTTDEILSKLRPVFKAKGSVTAGNSSQTSDGAAMVLLMSKEKAEELEIEIIATFKSFAATGIDPGLMGLGPITAIPKALKIAGVAQKDVDLYELNEAFASQAIACMNELSLDAKKVNVNGGAISLGHPLGCTGSFLTVKLLSELKRKKKDVGVVSMCIGGGMGAAAVFELNK